MAKKGATNKKSKAVAKRSTPNPPAPNSLMRRHAQRGLQNMKPEDMALPFFGIVQSGSPERRKNHEKYIKGAQEGHMFNSVTKDIYESAEIIPISYRHMFIEWKPYDQGGGFVGIHEPDSAMVTSIVPDEKGKRHTDKGTYLEDTMQYYIMILCEDGTLQRAVMSFKSTQLKKARRWNSRMQALEFEDENGKFTPAIYCHTYRVTTVDESNDYGNWKGWNIEPERPLPEELLPTVDAFYTAVESEAVIVDQSKAPDAAAVDADDDPFD